MNEKISRYMPQNGQQFVRRYLRDTVTWVQLQVLHQTVAAFTNMD